MSTYIGQGYSRRFIKRLVDIVVATVLLLILSPLLAIVAVMVRYRLGSPVIFRQPRPGKDCKSFDILKFRTMTDAVDADGRLLPDACRLTPFGQWLRSTSLDELPELWNVIRGEMSLVGPRPLKPEYLSLYDSEQARRHEVTPGITGWAQVNGRNSLDWEQKFKLDVWYVDHHSLSLDLLILVKTVAYVFGRKGISAAGHSTMPDFQGTPAPRRVPVVVIGAGGHGKVVVSTLQAAGVQVDAVYDDNDRLWGSKVLGVSVCGPIDDLHNGAEVSGVLGIGNNAVRERLASKLPIRWLTVVHPRSHVDPSVVLGEGTIVFAGAVVQPDVVVGRHTIINTCASIDHDCVIGSFVAVSPGANLSGGVNVGDRALLGTGSSAIPGVHIANDATVGAGTVVIFDVPAGSKLVGATPRFIQQSNDLLNLKRSA